jgi:hypothetical protein
MISGFHCGVNEIFDIFGFYAAHILVGGNCALMGYYAITNVLGLTGCPEMSVRKISK